MNQRQIAAFRYTMQHGSITAAAQALHVSQPAISRLIADLEHSVGFSLFVRQGGKVQPTLEAVQLLEEVERVFYGLDRLAQAASEIKDMRRAALHIATLPMASFDVVPQTLKRFLAEYQGVKVTHNVYPADTIIDMLGARQLDLGIAQTRVDRRDIDVVASYRTYCVCVMAPDHPFAERSVLTPADLADAPMIALAHHTVTANYVTQSFALAGVSPNIVLESQPSYSACGLAAIGIGLTIVDPLTPKAFGDRLKSIRFEPNIPFDFQLIKPADIPMSRAARALANSFLETLSETSDVRPLTS